MFHFGQCLYRKIQDLGLTKKYAENLVFHLHCNMLLALAFVKPDKVVDAWRQLQNLPDWAIGEDDELNAYFLDNYIGAFTGRQGKQKRPLFATEFWNCHQRVKDGIHRTTNNIEAWHLAFTRTVGSGESSHAG